MGTAALLHKFITILLCPLRIQMTSTLKLFGELEIFKNALAECPEGIWLAETAVDAETLEVLIDLGIRYTILSPYQAQCVRKLNPENQNNEEWHDVSWGSIDPSQPYRYYVEGTDNKKFIDLFFYDGAISKSVAFDFLLTDGEKICKKVIGWIF